MSVNVASTAATVSEGESAGDGSERSDAHPTPIWRCGSSPDSQDTAIITRRPSVVDPSSSAIRATFASREDVAVTSAEAAATSPSNMPPGYAGGRTRPHFGEIEPTQRKCEKGPACFQSRATGVGVSAEERQPTSKETDGQPVAPSGAGVAWSWVCTAPVLSVARAVMLCVPGLSACHGKLHSRQASLE